MSRVATNHLIDLAIEGVLDWESIARECLAYMSEDEVRDMVEGITEYLFSNDDDDEDENDD